MALKVLIPVDNQHDLEEIQLILRNSRIPFISIWLKLKSLKEKEKADSKS